MNNQIEKRDGIIVIGMISSGKSTFLNSLLGITYLKANDNIITKMVTAIRYNPDLTEPKFYHLKIIEKENEYSFERDGDEFIGKENIIKAISDMNKKEASNQPKYENLFYMLETNILTIENKDFLLHHDFYDIPGLNEYIVGEKKEEEKKEEKKKEEEKKEEEKKEDEKTKEKKKIKNLMIQQSQMKI